MRTTILDPAGGAPLTVDYHPIYTAAFVAAGCAPVISIAPGGGGALPPDLSVSVAAFSYHAVRPAGGWGTVWRPLVPGAAERSSLEQISSRIPAEIEIRRGDATLGRLPVLLANVWQWPHEAGARALVASYVVPSDRAVAQVVSDALAAAGLGPEVESAGRWTPEEIARAARALYRHLADTWDLRYETPRLDFQDDGARSLQWIRSPQEVLSHQAERRGQGNCLDLSLFFAGCFESLGLPPVLCFVGAPDAAPVHAFPGVWTAPARRFEPVITRREKVAAAIAAGELLVFEATGVCAGSASLPVERALAAARERAASGEAVHAVDLAAARPPAGVVRSLDPPHAAPVQRALWRAQTEARGWGSGNLETLHVLYGLCGPEPSLTRRLLERFGEGPDRVRALIERSRPASPVRTTPIPTQNFELCWTAARGYARAGGRSRLEEADLLWAVLRNPSRNVKRVLTAAGCDLPALMQELEAEGGPPGQTSVSLDLPDPSGRSDFHPPR